MALVKLKREINSNAFFFSWIVCYTKSLNNAFSSQRFEF